MKRAIFTFVFFISIYFHALAYSQETSKIKMTPLLTFKSSCEEGSLTFSSNKEKASCKIKEVPKEFFIINDKKEKAYDKVENFSFSEDGKNYSYTACGNKKCFVVFNGKELEAYDKVGAPEFNKNWTSYAYQAIKNGKQFIVWNGVRQSTYEAVLPPILSEDGTELLYAIERNNQYFFVVNGKEEKAYDEILYWHFPRNGKLYAYEARKGNQHFVIINGKESVAYEEVALFDVEPSYTLFLAKKNGKNFFVLNGVEQKPYEDVFEPVVSKDGKSLVYQAKLGNKKIFVVNGREGKKYEDISSSQFSINFMNNQVAYAAKDKKKYFLVLNGKEYHRFTTPGGVSVNPIKNQIAFLDFNENTTKQSVVLDGKKGKEYDDIYIAEWSPDGNVLAYIAKREKESFVVVNGKEGKNFDEIPSHIFFFGLEGKSINYNAILEGKVYWVKQDI